jgi:hypothetical protein
MCTWSFLVYTLNQVACFMKSLFTNCSRQNGESWQWRHYHANWGNSPSVPLSQERGRSCVCVLGLSYTSCFCDFPLDVRTKQYTENERLNNTNHTNNRRVCLQIVPAKMENPDNEDIIMQIEETLHLFLWPNNITTFFPFPVMFYLPCAQVSWYLYHKPKHTV